METTTKTTRTTKKVPLVRKSEPKTWLIKNGVRTEFELPPLSGIPSKAAIWAEKHPNFGKILDYEAVMQ
ncbi:MAG: hypothetical protein LBQ31_05920 [Bacteroidales bacterium]|jgi:hypothetical protein|nr:hypothetical protein [Bacteroidales bacterium]